MEQLTASVENLSLHKKGMEKYACIMRQVRATNVSSDEDFQRTFAGFYKVRRNAAWRKAYFDLFEANKHDRDVSFASILRSMFGSTGRIEASFSSKMLATLRPEMPIWDSIVLAALHVKPCRDSDKQKRLERTIELYDSIVCRYDRFASLPESDALVRAFDAAFPEYVGFSKTKKIDFLIWGGGADPFAETEDHSRA
ncbi:MAG: hypothetical protein IJT44_06565 [Clostridia bacterium]|nr:hypothetical protein [Clostridia bacterium]